MQEYDFCFFLKSISYLILLFPWDVLRDPELLFTCAYVEKKADGDGGVR